MAKTLAQMRSIIENMIDQTDTGSDSFMTESQLNQFINLEYNGLCREIIHSNSNYFEKWSSDLTVTSGVATVDLPSDFVGPVKAVKRTDCDPEVALDSRKSRKYYLLAPGDGIPESFAFEGKKLWLYPKPNVSTVTLSVLYGYLPADLTIDTQEFDFPLGCEQLIAWGVVIMCRLKGYEDLSIVTGKYEKMKFDMLTDIGKPKQTFSYGRIRNV